MTDPIHPPPNPLPPPPEGVADPPRWVAEKKEGEGEKICRTQVISQVKISYRFFKEEP